VFFVGYNFKMSTYSEATLPFDVHSDTDEVEFNSVNDIDTDSDTDGVEFNSVNDVDTDSDTDSDTEDIKVNSNNDVRTDGDADGVEFNHGNGVCNEQGKENFDGYKCISDVTDDDIRDMEFNTEDEAIKFYVLFAKYHGFEVRKDDVKRDSNGNIIMRQLVCNKEGVNDGKNKKNGSRSTLTIRTNCSAKLRVVYDFVRTIWRVSIFKPSHNHELAPLRFVHLMPNYRKLSEVDKQVASGLHSQGVRTCHILGFLMGQKGGHEGLGFIKKDLYNFTDHQARVKIQDGDTFATLSYFQGKADTDTSFFSEFTFTDDGRLENIFWADSTSRFDYECFGDVVAFDTTYRKNKYGKPLVIFSGYNHHGETTIFACALICDETIETYKWVLNLFSKAMYDKHPKAVITDGDKSMRKAIRVVFPNTRHRLCAWHLHRNAVQHVKNSKFLEEFKSLMYSPCTPEKFESEWKRVVENFDLSNNRWVKKIYRLKRMWASAYMRDHFLCGVRTTSICEGVNSFIKKYVRHKNSLVDFLHNFERALKEYRHNELLSDFKSFYYHPMLTTALTTFESEASKIFTGKKFKDVKKAIEDVVALSVIERDEDEDGNIVIFKVNVFGKKDVAFSVYLDKLQTKFLCDCRRFERRGLPCSHIICAMKYDNMDVFPESLICKRWTKTAKSDHISSFASQEGNDEKMTMFRRGALAAAFNSLCDVSCKSASDYKEALEGIYSLCNKINSRHEGNGHDEDKASKFVASDKANKFVANDPLMVNVKGARRSKKSTPRTRCCSNCRNPGHTIRTCPELAGIGVVSEDQGEKASPIESDNESKSLSVS
jgi:hypothetical protein